MAVGADETGYHQNTERALLNPVFSGHVPPFLTGLYVGATG
jgi:hypothetical protein